MSAQRGSHGITLVGVLAVLVIVGLLLALLLPLVQRSREAARLNQCAFKMQQLGLALQEHHTVHNLLPATSNQRNAGGVASVWWPAPGSGATTGAIPSLGYTTAAGSASATAGYSWIVKILPYLDEASLYGTIADASGEFSADAFTPFDVAGARDGGRAGQTFSVTTVNGSSTVRRHFAAVPLYQLICPSFSGTAQVAPSQYSGTPAGNPPASYGYPSGSKDLGSPAQFAAITNYVATAATHFPLMQYATEPNLAATTTIPEDAEAPNGVIVPGIGVSLKDCFDGTTRTAMVCETVEPAMNSWYDGTTAWTTGINPNSIAAFPPDKTGSAVSNPMGNWNVPTGGQTALDIGPAPITTVAYSPALTGYCAAPQVISWGPSSNHAGGIVNHLTIDGVVHGINPDIDPAIYMQLITRAGREESAPVEMVR
jgi:type II secretory pathway pseudopilin PulG